MGAYFSISELAKMGQVYLWTFTRLPIEESIKDQRKAWNSLLTMLKRRFPSWAGVRVFELHKIKGDSTHGIHVHVVSIGWLDVDIVRGICRRTRGWGRIDVVKITRDPHYVSKYLGKERPECLKGWRLWSSFGHYRNTRCCDVLIESNRTKLFFFLAGRFMERWDNLAWNEKQQWVSSWERWLAASDCVLVSSGEVGGDDYAVHIQGVLNPKERSRSFGERGPTAIWHRPKQERNLVGFPF